jgi:hypothetical protein
VLAPCRHRGPFFSRLGAWRYPEVARKVYAVVFDADTLRLQQLLHERWGSEMVLSGELAAAIDNPVAGD